MTKESREIQLIEKLSLKKFKLNALLEITTAINENTPKEELLDLYSSILIEDLDIEKIALFYKDKEWSCILKNGITPVIENIDVEKRLASYKEISIVEPSDDTIINEFEVIIPVYHKNNPLAYLMIGDFSDDPKAINQTGAIEHMPFIQTLTNIIIVAIENKRLANEAIEQAKVRKELEFASEMQEMLFPRDLPNNDKLEAAGYHQPHNLVGGDYYDFIEISETEFVFCIADVSGKGVSAALLMANFQANMKAIIAKHYYFTMSDMVQDLNTKVMESAKGEKFITFFVAYFDFKTGILKYINAGHNPPVLLTKDKTELLEKGCTGLGMFDTIPDVDVGILELDTDTLIQGYTDGIVEQENEEGEFYDLDRLKKLLRTHVDKSCTSINDEILKDIERFKGATEYSDDLTLLNCKIKIGSNY